MRWFLVDSDTPEAGARWLFDDAPREGRSFVVVPATYDFQALAGQRTSAALWRILWRHSQAAWEQLAASTVKPCGLITTFPPLGLLAGLRNRCRWRRVPVVAWHFNVGSLYGGLKGLVARFAARGIDAFVVHSRAELKSYSEWLRLPASRFHFVPLARPLEPVAFEEDRQDPFVLAMGSAQRDYPLLVQAVSALGLRTVIVASPHAVQGIQMPACVTVQSDLSWEACNALAQRARLCVVPVLNDQTASGQVTVIGAMMYGRATIATRCVGSVDYMDHGVDGWLVPPGSAQALQDAIQHLWSDAALRQRLGQAARQRVATQLNDQASGAHLDAILLGLERP
jgi:glycosyltransferase involved in cell wall biosynthesis